MQEAIERNPGETIADQLKAGGVSRRSFLEMCAMVLATAPAGLALTHSSATHLAEAAGRSKRPSVIWLHFQDCTGCTETLLHTSQPDLAELIFNVISLDYHETLMAASGYQAEAALRLAVEKNSGEFVLVVEGAIPTGAHGQYMKLAGQPALQVLREIGAKAGLVIAIGSCASWGGIASADPNPTGAVGVDSVLAGKTIVNLPGCPPNPYNFLSVLLEYVTTHRLPALDQLNRPKFAYDRVIHEDCPRRAHFDAGRFAGAFGDEGHRHGWCLYKLGCKGPVTHASCSTRHFNEMPNCWPIGIGAPCIGCTEKATAFRTPLFQTVDIHLATPPEAFPSVDAPHGDLKAVAAATIGAMAGIAGTAALMASRRLPNGGSSLPIDAPDADANQEPVDGDTDGKEL